MTACRTWLPYLVRSGLTLGDWDACDGTTRAAVVQHPLVVARLTGVAGRVCSDKGVRLAAQTRAPSSARYGGWSSGSGSTSSSSSLSAPTYHPSMSPFPGATAKGLGTSTVVARGGASPGSYAWGGGGVVARGGAAAEAPRSWGGGGGGGSAVTGLVPAASGDRGRGIGGGGMGGWGSQQFTPPVAAAPEPYTTRGWGASSFEASAVGTAGGGGGAASEPPISLLGKHVAFVDLDNMAGALDDITDQFDVLFAYAGASYNGPLPRARALPFAGSLVTPPVIKIRRGGTQRKDEADVYCMWDVVSYASQLPSAASVYFISADAIFNTMAAVIEKKVEKRIEVVSSVAEAKRIVVPRPSTARWG